LLLIFSLFFINYKPFQLNLPKWIYFFPFHGIVHLKFRFKTNFFHYLSIELIYSNKKKWGDLLGESKGRHELKHFINYADILQLRLRLPYVASIDKNAIDGKGYRVRSLYFDNYNDKVLREKIDGVNEREKFRLRLYNDDTSFIKLEKKSKKNGISYKESTRQPKLAAYLLKERWEGLPLNYKG